MLLLALYKSRRHSNTLLLLNKSIWLSLKAWILPNDETFGAVMLVAEYWTYRLYMMFIIIKLKLTQLYIYIISLNYRTLLCYGDYQVCFAIVFKLLFYLTHTHTYHFVELPAVLVIDIFEDLTSIPVYVCLYLVLSYKVNTVYIFWITWTLVVRRTEAEKSRCVMFKVWKNSIFHV